MRVKLVDLPNAIVSVFRGDKVGAIPSTFAILPLVGNGVILALVLYPHKAGKIELYHITPKYLGCAKNGPLVLLGVAYHQQIIHAFRKAWPYGQGKPNAAQLQKIMDDVYGQVPLPRLLK